MASFKEIEEVLAGIPPVQYVAAGSCGVKYVSKGLEIVCCRPGKAEFTTLASDPLDNKVPNKVARDTQGLPTVPHNDFGGLNFKGLASNYLLLMATSPYKVTFSKKIHEKIF